MNDLNIAIFLGRSTGLVKVKKFNNRYRYSFTVALNYTNKKSGAKHANFVPITIWSDYDDAAILKLKKGQLINIKGRINVRSYTDNDQKRWMTEVIADEYRLLEKSEENQALKVLEKDMDSNQEIMAEIEQMQNEKMDMLEPSSGKKK